MSAKAISGSHIQNSAKCRAVLLQPITQEVAVSAQELQVNAQELQVNAQELQVNAQEVAVNAQEVAVNAQEVAVCQVPRCVAAASFM